MAGLPQQVNGLQDISQQIQTAAWDVVLSRYISAAALTWLLYDHVLTFEKERTWIWSNKVTITKVLFLINRYSTPLVILSEIILYSGRVQLTDNACRGWLFFEALWQSFSALIAQFLLGLRMCAIWGSRPWTKAILYIGCLICAGASITSITLALARVSSSYHYFTPLQTCYTTEPLPSWLWAAFFLPIMVFDLLIFLMTVWNVVLGHSEHVRKNSLTFMMWRDGTIYFGLIFASELACVLISALKGFGTTMTIKFAVWSLQNVVIGHMTINLVEAVRGPSADIVPTSFLDMSTRDLSGRPSASMIWKARKSTMVDTIDVDGSHASPIILTRTLPSQPEGAAAARIMSHEDEWTRNPDTRDFNVLPTIGQDWNDSSFGWQDLFRGDEAQWAEVYSSGKAERSHAMAGSSKQAAAFEPDRLDDPEADGSVIPVGTGRSRLLTTSNRRPSILTKEDLAELMGHGSSLGHDLVGVNRHALWGSDVGGASERVPSRAVSSSEGYHPAVVGDSNSGKAEEDSSLQRKKRLDQLVEALTTPPSPTVPLSPRRPGFF